MAVLWSLFRLIRGYPLTACISDTVMYPGTEYNLMGEREREVSKKIKFKIASNFVLQDYQLFHRHQVYCQEVIPAKLVFEAVLEMLKKKTSTKLKIKRSTFTHESDK